MEPTWVTDYMWIKVIKFEHERPRVVPSMKIEPHFHHGDQVKTAKAYTRVLHGSRTPVGPRYSNRDKKTPIVGTYIENVQLLDQGDQVGTGKAHTWVLHGKRTTF